MREVNWLDVKEGEIFTIPEPLSVTFSSWLGTGRDPETAYQRLGTYFYRYGGDAIFAHPNHDSGYYARDSQARNLLIKQPVQVVEEAELTGAQRIAKMCTKKVNNYSGTDPEIFVVRGREKEELLPAFRFLPTQADEAKKYSKSSISESLGQFHPSVSSYAYRDGFAAEAWINPVTCHGYLVDFIRHGLGKISAAAKTFDRTARLTVQNVFRIPEITMASAGDDEVALGCMPSLNAYGAPADLTLDAREFRMRFAGGHVHLAMKLSTVKAREVAKGCDLIAGIAGVAMFAGIDDPVRRQYYGKAGEYRAPSHGIEYRTLSNAWLCDPGVTHLTLNLVRAGAKIGFNKQHHLFGISEEEVQGIINECDVKAARKFITANEKIYRILLAAEGLPTHPDAMEGFRIITQGGVPEMFPNFAAIEDNWKIGKEWRDHSDNLSASWGHKCTRKATA